MSMDGGASARRPGTRDKPAPVVIIGFDAMDCDTALGFAADGAMPVLADLLTRAARCPLRLAPGLFVNCIWADFATGLTPDRHGFICWDEIDVATYRRRLAPAERVRGVPFWRRLAASGHATASIDVPHNIVRDCTSDPARALEIAEWSCHDRHIGLQVWPPAEREKVLTDYGLHPIFGMEYGRRSLFAPDDYLHRAGLLRTAEEMRQLIAEMVDAIPTKTRMLRDYLAKQEWDLFLAVYGESHAAAHQFWHMHDPSHPWFDGETQRLIGGDPIRRIYAALDTELGRLLDGLDKDATLLLLLSHGVGGHYGGTHLLEDVLGRIDMADRRASGEAGWAEPALRQLRHLGDRALRSAGRLLRPVARREFASPGERARQRFFLEPNNTLHGGVRLNLMGREPRGRVSADAAESVLASLERDLLALVNPRTGRPAIRDVFRADQHYRREPGDSMPDLLIDWNDEALIEAVWSPKTGLIEVAYDNWRSGDHRDRSLMLAAGPGIAAGADLSAMTMQDIAASVLARFGEDVGDLDGKPASWLAQARAVA